MWHIFKLKRGLWLKYTIYFAISLMISSLGNMEIKSQGLPSNYAEAHQLRAIDLEHPDLLEMQHADLNLEKYLVLTIIFFLKKTQFLIKI